MHTHEELYRLFTAKLKNEAELLKYSEPENLYKPAIYTLENGGKRIRPILLLMAHELYSLSVNKSLCAAFAIEIFHNFTLLHDDIMDDAPIRRNRETVHIKYSTNSAILSGDAMSILAYQYLGKCKTDNFEKIFNIFTHTALQICEGQQYDMDFETRNNVSVEEYMKMIGYKTAVLLAASLQIGALMANAPDDDAKLLYDFGYNLGMAFQLQDDYLDSYGNTASFGKSIGGDILANKKTFMLLKAFELANHEQTDKLKRLINTEISNSQEKIDSVISIYNQLDIAALVKQEMEKYYNKAITCLKNVKVEPSKKTELLREAKKMMQRVS